MKIGIQRKTLNRCNWIPAFAGMTGARDAIRREKTIMGWPRRWKINAIERDNPEWFDLTRRLNRQVTAWIPENKSGHNE